MPLARKSWQTPDVSLSSLLGVLLLLMPALWTTRPRLHCSVPSDLSIQFCSCCRPFSQPCTMRNSSLIDGTEHRGWGSSCSVASFLANKSLLKEKSQDVFGLLIPSKMDTTENGVLKFKQWISNFSNLFKPGCVVTEKRELQ